jgi:deoxyribodipyrimidine photo-lyase
MTSTAILWYRRDLRVTDHPALRDALAAHDRVVPAFVLDDALLHGRYASGSRAAFMLGCLRRLGDALRRRGSDLVVRHGRPEQEIPALAAECGASAVYWTSDVTPYARARDGRVTDALRAADVAPHPSTGNYVIDVGKPRTKGGAPFRVFSPFSRAWGSAGRRDVGRAPRTMPALPARLARGRLPSLDALGLRSDVRDPVVEPGEEAARRALAAFLAGPVEHYAGRSGIPAGGTSVLSPYLRFGCLSPRECEERARERGGRGAQAWVRQLCWRDFYAHLLLHHPDSATQELQQRYRGALRWSSSGSASRPGRRDAPGSRSSTPGCASSARPGGCTTASGSSSARS